MNQKKCKSKPNPIRFFTNGSKIFFVAYDAADLSKIRGEEYGIIMAEEANLFPSTVWSEFLGRLSQEYGTGYDGAGKPYQNKIKNTHIIYVANSGGKNWLWKIFRRDNPNAYFPWKQIYGFIDRNGVWNKPILTYENWEQNKKYLALEWGTNENKGNLRADYWEDLQQLPEHLFKRLAEADDEPLEGMVFPNFDRRVHEVKIKSFIPPPHWPVYLGLDYGYRTPTVCLWIAVSEEGAFVVFNEYRATMKSPSENAHAILSLNESLVRRGMQDHKIAYIDLSSGFKKGESESGASVFDQLVAAGMNRLAKSSRDLDGRVVRIATLLEPNKLLLRHPVTGQIRTEGWPRLMLTSDCLATIQEIEEWEWSKAMSDSKDPLEKPEQKDDHGIDAMGYVLVKVTSKAPLDYDSERMFETSHEKELDDYKRIWCGEVMQNERSGHQEKRGDGVVY